MLYVPYIILYVLFTPPCCFYTTASLYTVSITCLSILEEGCLLCSSPIGFSLIFFDQMWGVECCTNCKTLRNKLAVSGCIIKIASTWIVAMTGRLQVHKWVPCSVLTQQSPSVCPWATHLASSCPSGASRQPPAEDWFMGQTFFHTSKMDAWKPYPNMTGIN